MRSVGPNAPSALNGEFLRLMRAPVLVSSLLFAGFLIVSHLLPMLLMVVLVSLLWGIGSFIVNRRQYPAIDAWVTRRPMPPVGGPSPSAGAPRSQTFRR